MITEIIRAIEKIDHIDHILILEPNGDTHFSDSLIVEEGTETMELFIQFLALANKLKIAENNQFSSADWEFEVNIISMFKLKEITFIIARNKISDLPKLLDSISQIIK